MRPVPGPAPIEVLLVEDNVDDAALTVRALEQAKLRNRVHLAVTGVEALAILRREGRHAGASRPDLILLDLDLPAKDGREVLAEIKADDELRDIPVVVVTGSHAPAEPIVVISGLDDERLALEAVRSGAQDYLVKGRIEGHLLARVLRYAVERKRGEEALRASEAHHRTILENIGDAVFIADPQGRYLDVNPRACELTGYSRDELLQLTVLDTYPAQDRDAAALRIVDVAGGRAAVTERPLLRKDGAILVVESNARRLPDGRLLGAVRDITERKRLEEQLRQAQKMEAVGRLAGGVAHDFNNVLTAIFGYADLLNEELPDGHQARLDLDEIRKAAQRASALTRQLLAFSRQQVLEPVVLQLNGLVEDIQNMLVRLIGEDVQLRR